MNLDTWIVTVPGRVIRDLTEAEAERMCVVLQRNFGIVATRRRDEQKALERVVSAREEYLHRRYDGAPDAALIDEHRQDQAPHPAA